VSGFRRQYHTFRSLQRELGETVGITDGFMLSPVRRSAGLCFVKVKLLNSVYCEPAVRFCSSLNQMMLKLLPFPLTALYCCPFTGNRHFQQEVLGLELK
jgi:hypothetical protein